MDNINVALWKFIFDLIQTAFVIGITIYVWVLNKHKVNQARINKLEDAHNEELHGVKNRLTEIETTIKHMPDKRSVHNIHERMNKQMELLKRMEGEMKGVSDTTHMIQQTLMKRGEKE